MRILVPFNGTDSSWKAINYALDMAKRNNLIRITVIAVDSRDYRFMSVNPNNNPFSIIDDFYNYLINQTKKIKDLFLKESVPLNVMIEKGDVAKSILKAVDDLYIDHIIMGRGKLSTLEVILGSIIYKVIADIKIPVTLLR
ncbi:universal stress protein [Desulforamulus aeronauticus]|uniref:Nucleotide-binding universal stress protein, UspA family n=1 Tax=Desulforamulus aeronauticus DSM 10349 TaxID=1121421 RepID=A0A1M6QC97_9FIRM|nr:universal stress protein [Desulforamulus aeronauticus]SHK17909.1 Nucleotide-binding universal stress protein, UspA family [Desulforamulus aeronauticus DSM 10349]